MGWLTGWKSRVHLYIAYKIHTDQKWGNGKKIPPKWKQRQSWVAILIANKTDFKTKSIIKDKGHYIKIKRTIQEEDKMFINICTNINRHEGTN